MPNPNFVAEVTCNGSVYRNWTSVTVRRDFMAAASDFTLTCAEVSKAGTGWAGLKLKPGDAVTIKLAGQQAINGRIVVRQAALNANAHAVAVQGRSKVGDIVDSSHVTKGGLYKNYTFEQIAKGVVAPFGVSFTMKNPPEDATRPFPRAQVYHGETAFQFLERLARMRGVFLNDDTDGNLVGGKIDESGSSATLEEGKNIVSISAVVNDESLYSRIMAVGQQKGSDDLWGKDAAQISATAANDNVQRYRPLVVVAEEPSSQKDLQDRANREQSARIGTSVQVTVLVKGWLRADGKLWEPGKLITVKAPSIFPNDGGVQTLGVQSVTFSQVAEAPGTTTSLELVLPQAMGARFGGLAPGGDNADLFKSGAKPAEPTAEQVAA